MYYFCYISEHKVDQLLSQYANGPIESTQETRELSRRREYSFGTKLLSLITGEAKFGKAGRILVSQDRRSSLVTKLLQALKLVEEYEGEVRALDQQLSKGGTPPTGVYSYVGRFRATSCDGNYAHLSTKPTDAIELILTCSIKYFSDMGEASGKTAPHSGNALFFEGKISPEFTSVFYLLDTQPTVLCGTPLFLALPMGSTLKL